MENQFAFFLSSQTAGSAARVSSILDPISAPAEAISELSLFVLGLCAAIFVLVAGLLVYTSIRFRCPSDDDGREPPQVYGSNPIELAWTIVPVLIVFVLFLVTARTIFEMGDLAPAPDALKVTVVGHQWWWEIRYPQYGIVTANELHVPVSGHNTRRPTILKLESADVVHSFWVPRLAGKTDVIPNRENMMWIEPWEAGTFLGQCAEYCGTQHAHMLLRVIVHSQDEFEQWLAAQQKPPVNSPAVQAGRALFLSTACVECHAIEGTAATGSVGPDLSHLMSRATLGAGVTTNTPHNLRAWVHNPQQFKPGVLMPDMRLTQQELDHISAYLLTLE